MGPLTRYFMPLRRCLHSLRCSRAGARSAVSLTRRLALTQNPFVKAQARDTGRLRPLVSLIFPNLPPSTSSRDGKLPPLRILTLFSRHCGVAVICCAGLKEAGIVPEVRMQVHVVLGTEIDIRRNCVRSNDNLFYRQ